MTLSPLASRIVAWGLLANLVWGAGIFVIGPLLTLVRRDSEEIVRSRQLLARYRQIEAEFAGTQVRLTQLRGASTYDKHIFVAASSALSAAEMQNNVQKLVSSAGASLRSSKTVAPAAENGFDRLAVDLDLAASNSVLMTLLRAIALAEPALLVDRMTVQVPESGQPSTDSDGQPTVAISLRLVSYGRSPVGAKR